MSWFCNLFGCNEVTTSSGYPAYSRVWVVLSECSRCGKKYRTTDDLFIGPRPSDFPIDKDFMVNKK